MYRRSGLLILMVLSIVRIDLINASYGNHKEQSPDYIYCQQCQQQNRGCVSQGCTPTCLQGYVDDGEGNCVEQERGSSDVTNQDQNIDQLSSLQSSDRDKQDSKAASDDSAPVAQALRAQEPRTNAAGIESTFFGSFTMYVVVAGCSVAGLVGLVVAGVCWYRLQKNVKAASEAEYPAYGVTGPAQERASSPGDRKLAQSAQMYHYQHQKQQMLALEKANSEMKQDGSDDDSDEENEEGDYTVYECPGLAPTGEMEVKNPLFDDTPVTPMSSAGNHVETEK